MATLSPEQQATAKAFFLSLYYVSLENKGPTTIAESPVFSSMSPNYLNYLDRLYGYTGLLKIRTIFNTLANGKATLSNIQAVQEGLQYHFKRVGGIFLKAPTSTTLVNVSETAMFNYFAWICANKGWFWDNSATSPTEFVELTKTPLGEALATFDCFSVPLYKDSGVAAAVDNAATDIAKTTKNIKAGSSARKVPDYDPKREYRTLGPLSGKLSGLKDPNKFTFTEPMFCIEADNSNNTTKRTLFITPLDVFGTSTGSYGKRVKVGAANGYSDCQLWWADYDSAKLALAQVSSGAYDVKNQRYGDVFQIKKAKPDANGYFYIDTHLGPAYIKASKMNEELGETLAEEIDMDSDDKISSRYSPITVDVRDYTESFKTYGD